MVPIRDHACAGSDRGGPHHRRLPHGHVLGVNVVDEGATLVPEGWENFHFIAVRHTQRSLIEKKGQLGLWQCQASVPSALLLNALNFALNFFLFDTAFSNILCQHYRTNNARMLVPSN